ncbi:MAG: helix-turn-helix domain-containing protein [Chloroflexota bacterium]
MMKKPLIRPTSGGTHHGERPMRYHYWRTGYGLPLPLPLEFWVSHAGEYHCKANYITDNYDHTVGTVQFFYHIEGGADFRDGLVVKPVAIGDLFIIPKDRAFTYRAKSGMKYHWFAIEGNWPAMFYQQDRVLSLGYDAEVEQKFIELRETLILRQPGYTLQAVSIVFALMARIHDIAQYPSIPDSGYPDPVRNAITLLRENYAEPFSTAQTAEAVGLSPSHLRTLFEKWVGESPQQFHTRYRIDQAKRLLTQQSLTIYEVAHHIGYVDVRYFSRVFKQFTGVSPSQYAKQHLE